MSKVFLKRGITYSQTEGNFNVLPTLDDGIYQIKQTPMTGELYLERIADSFHFGFKLYGIDEKLVGHVINTYNNQPNKKNIGVLLNGAKGTGKTVTAEVIANRLGLPIILCDEPYPGLNNFLASINHDCVFFFDEFEKNFRMRCEDDDCAGEDLLSIMDGVYNSNNCHVFILTTNELKINDNLISRPSRIRYLKSFNSVLDKKVLEEFIDDNLIYKEFKDEIIEFIESLTLATIDIVKTIVDEVNIHKCGVDEFKHFFNVKEALYRYSIRCYSFDINSKHISKKQFLDSLDTPFNEKAEIRPVFDTIKLKRPIYKLKEGDFISSRLKIKEIDMSKGYVLTQDNVYKETYRHFFFENIDEKPSIWDNNIFYAYNDGYDDYSW